MDDYVAWRFHKSERGHNIRKIVMSGNMNWSDIRFDNYYHTLTCRKENETFDGYENDEWNNRAWKSCSICA